MIHESEANLMIVIDRTRSDQATVIRIRTRLSQTRRERGAAAVEMAIVLPLLLAMIIGIIDFGRIFNGEIQISQAAREGARIAALGVPAGYGVSDVQTRTGAAMVNPAFQSGAITISVDVVDATGGSITGGTGRVCTDSDASSNYSRVTISIPYQKILWGPANISQKAIMKCTG